MNPRRLTQRVPVGALAIGGQEPIRIQSMTNTPTEDVKKTAKQILELVQAGSELVRVTVNTEKAAQAVPEIKKRLEASGIHAPVIGDFHYNGHLLLEKFPECAKSLDKYRINPGNVGRGGQKNPQFQAICRIAAAYGKPIRIGVNHGSLDPDLMSEKLKENETKKLGKAPGEVISACMIASALRSLELALNAGLKKDQIVLSCKTSSPGELIALYTQLSQETDQPLHVGLTEAGGGMRGIVHSTSALSVLLSRGIGDTVRVSLTPLPGGSRAQEVLVAREILQSLGLRFFSPQVVSCPGCGRTDSVFFQELAAQVQHYFETVLPVWRVQYPGVEKLTVAVMGCVVNGPGESKNADIGLSLPGKQEEPSAVLYADGRQAAILKGSTKKITKDFLSFIEKYVSGRFG